MKRVVILMFMALFLSAVMTLAAAPAGSGETPQIVAGDPQAKNVGDAHELDTAYESPFNVNFAKWFAEHPLQEAPKTPLKDVSRQIPTGQQAPRMDVVFKTPRVVVLAMSIKGNFPLHYHTSSDEILIPIKGKCKEYVNGKWTWIQPGDIHYNPRGVVHGLQCEEGMEFQSFDIFTPSLPEGGDRVFIDSKESKAKPGDIVADWKLIDTQYKSGVVINVDDWYASHAIPPGQSMRMDLPMGTIRNQMVLAQKPVLAAHYHGSSDEIIYVYKGMGEELINGQWVKLQAGEIHFCPRGFIHAIRPLTENFKIFAFFTPPSANGSDRIFVTPSAAPSVVTTTPAPAK